RAVPEDDRRHVLGERRLGASAQRSVRERERHTGRRQHRDGANHVKVLHAGLEEVSGGKSPTDYKVRGGTNAPKSCRRHHAPVRFFVSQSVNQYCQRTARTIAGGFAAKGVLRKSDSTCGEPSSSRC